METTVEFNEGHMTFNNGILHVTYKKGVMLDEDVFLSGIYHRKQITNDRRFFILLDVRQAAAVTESGLLFAAENPCPENVNAIAIVTSDGDHYLRAKLYALFDKPNILTKAFLTIEEAKNWFVRCGHLPRTYAA